jgi:small membrane protein
MKAIQFILIIGLILLGYFTHKRLPQYKAVRYFIYLVLAAGIFVVLQPDTTTDLAHLVGVGRGTDLLLYIYMVTNTFIILLLYTKLRKVREQINILVQDQAILKAKKLGTSPANHKDTTS